MKYGLTIITPTFNRKDLLLQLRESLLCQSCKNFQWIIIDDGSTDGTAEIVQKFQEAEFPTEYYWKENGGKHTALNYAHPFIEGEYVCVVDSDDRLTPDAVENILKEIEQFGGNAEIGCLSFLKGRNSENAPLADFPDRPTVANHVDFRINSERNGDCFEVVRTDVFKSYPFPEYPGERFMSEGFLWISIALHYQTVYIKKVIYICDYMEGGLTQSGRKLRVQCPLGGIANSINYLRADLNLKNLVKECLLYITYSKFAGYRVRKIVRDSNRKAWTIFLYPLGYLLYRYWKHLYL